MVALLVPGFPADEKDSSCLPAVQQFVLEFKKAIKQQIIVISFQYPFRRALYCWNDVTVYSLGGNNRRRIWRMLIWLRCYFLLRKLHRAESISGILSFWLTESALIGQIFGERNNIPHFMWIHGQDARAGNRYIKWIRP